MRKHNAEENDEPLELVHICGPTEAEMIAEMLKNNGIESTLQGEVAATTLPATGDLDEVRIWVAPGDAVRAKEIVEAFFSESAEIEDDDVEA